MREVNAMLEKLKGAGQSGAKALVAGGEVAVAQARLMLKIRDCMILVT